MASIVQAVRPTRLSLDSSETLRDEFNGQFICNTRRAININSQSATAGNPLDQGGNAGKGTPTQSTDLLCNITLPAGDNICIGAYESVKTNEIYYFVWNDDGNHSVWVYGTQDLTCRKVYQGECLNFQFPPEYHIPEHRVSLFVVYDQQDGEKTIRNKFLVFTDGYNWQYFIDVESAIATDSYNPITFPYFGTFWPHCDPCEFIQLGIRPPQDCPKVLPFDDDTDLQYYEPAPENNNLKEKAWYFATSFIDVWGRHSVISPYSTAVFLDGGDCSADAEDIKCFKLVLDAGSAIVDKIVVYFSNNGIDWFQYDVIDKWEDCVSPPDANFWEKELALKNYFAPIEDSPPDPTDCPAEGEFSTNTYTWDFSESPPLTFPTIISIEINGVDYTSPSVASTTEIAAWISSLGFGTAIAVSTVVFTSSDTVEFGDILFDDSPIEIIIPVEIITDHQEFGVANTFIYQFCANKQCIPIAASEVDRYFDDLPIASVAQAIVDDRIAYGDNLVGYDNFICPIDNIQITAVQDEAACETDIVTVIIDAVIQNPYTENNEPVWKLGTAVAFGGFGDLTVGGIDYENEVISIYQQQIVNEHQNFIGRLRGTNYIAYAQQFKIGTTDPITIPEPTTDKQRQNTMKGAYNGNFYYQRFTFKVPKGNYIFQIDSHLADGVVDSQYTSTYFWGAVAKSSYDPDGSITVDDSIREVRFTACEDFTYDHYVVIADLTKPKASISAEGDAKAFNGYLRKSDTDPNTETGHDPIELANVDITDCTALTKTITMWTPQTDHNGFYFGTDGGADYCVNITILDSTCSQVSPTGSINQISVSSKTLVVQNVIQTNPANFAECAYELITGTITDCNGNPVSGVSVVLSYTGRYGITDENGEYRILAHDSAYWEATLGQDRKTRNVDNLFIAPLGACLYNSCESPEDCNTCIELTHVDWTDSCFGSPACNPATNIYDFELDIISGALKGVKTAGTYAVSIIGYDYLDRNNSAQRVGFFSVPSIQSNGVFAPYHFNWSFTGLLDLPSWVKKIRFAVRGNDNQFLLSWVTNKVEFIDSIGDITGAGIATNIRVYIDGLNDFNTENFFNTNTTYSWVKGDRIRFITNGDGEVFDSVSNNGLIDLPISSLVDGHILLIPFDARLTDLTAGATFEIYRVPICTTEAVYLEQCPSIPVKFNEETQTYEPIVTSGTIPFFDTYWFFRAIPQTNQFGLPSLFISPHRFEHHSPSDFWGDHAFAIGRGFVRNENARQTWRLDEIQWSDTLLEDGVINGLGTWRTENRKDYSIQDFGGIVAMKAQRHFLWVLCENDWFAVNIAMNLLQITADGNVIANPDFFGAAQQKVGFVFGCDLRDTNTVLFKQGWITWVDVKHTAVCFSPDYHNVEDISLLDVKSYWMKKLQLIASLRDENQFTDAFMYLHSGYDPKTNEIIFTSFGRSGEGGDDPVEAQVQVTTENESAINEALWTFSAEDLCITSGANVYIDFTAEPQNSKLAAIRPKSIGYPGGSQSQYTVYPPTVIAADDGYNGTYQKWIPETFCASEGQPYNANMIGGNVNCMTFPASFLMVTIDLADQYGCGIVLSYNAAYGNITDFLFWIDYIKNTRGIPVTKVILGRENFNPKAYRNGYNWFGQLDAPPTPADLDIGGTNYRNAMQMVVNSIEALHPEIECAFDSAPIEKSSKFGNKWNAQVNGIDTDMPASYIMDEDFVTVPTGSTYDQMRDIVIDAIEKKLPERLDLWHAYYSTYDYLAITSWGTSGGQDKRPYAGHFLSALLAAHYFIQMVKYNRDNNDYINFSQYYRLSELKLDEANDENIEYFTLVLLGNIYKYANPKIVDVTTQFAGIYQLAVKTDTNYILIFINYYDTTIPVTSISIDGDNSDVVLCLSQHATSLEDEESTFETLSNPTILPFSITMVEVEPYVGESGEQGIISYANTLKDWSIESNETISFNVPGKFWSGSYGFTPECYACYENARNPNQLISFVQGRAWMHHNQSPTIITYNNFYGTQCEPVIKFVFNGGEQDAIIQKRWLAIRVECKQSLWYSDVIQTQSDQLSAIPIEAFEEIENYSEAEILCDINTINPNGLSALIDGDSLFGNYIKIRLLINPANVAEYFELDLILISAVQSY